MFKGLDAIDAYLAYQGSNKDYLQKAKIGSVPVNGYVKLCGSKTEAEKLALKKERLIEERKNASK